MPLLVGAAGTTASRPAIGPTSGATGATASPAADGVVGAPEEECFADGGMAAQRSLQLPASIRSVEGFSDLPC
jgi:hypothetical protein